MSNINKPSDKRCFLSPQDANPSDFIQCVSQKTDLSLYPSAESVIENVVVYHASTIISHLENKESEYRLKSEITDCLKNGPGVIAVKEAYTDINILNRCNQVFDKIIAAEKAGSGENRGDHFAKSGANERIWNSFQKLCEYDPMLFISYFSNPVLTFISESWLGPGFQMTAQMNTVKPGGEPQNPHRDYHLGFQKPEVIAEYPVHLHESSQFMTLQGAVAHSDMPINSGPTRLLPHSQKYIPGYLATANPEILDYFNNHYVSLPLKRGDALFFSPALFHAAGKNSSENDRCANLLQVSVSYGKAMESIDFNKIISLIYPHLLKLKQTQSISEKELRAVLACSCDGYSFPTNLDADPPLKGAAPKTQREFITSALNDELSESELSRALAEMRRRRQP